MSDENQQTSTEPIQTQPSQEASTDNAEPTPAENPTPNQSSQSSDDTGQVSEPNSSPASPQEPVPDTSIPPTESVSTEVPPVAPQASPSPESAVPVNNDIPANEPFESAPVPENVSISDNPNITVEKRGKDVTITEVMKPEPEEKTETAQMAGNEPFNKTPDLAKVTPGEQDKPTDLAEEIKTKQRQENLKLANETRQNKKQEKIEKILELFSENKEITNDEVEKLLHVSDATATRYLETLEKEGKIKQVGKTGKGVMYEKI